jgi:hypothetical protein
MKIGVYKDTVHEENIQHDMTLHSRKVSDNMLS